MAEQALRIQSDLKKLSSAIVAMASVSNSEEIIQGLLFNAFNKYAKDLKRQPAMPDKPLLAFTKQELKNMPKDFMKEFRTEGITARVMKRKISKNAFSYIIRYRRNGYNIVVCGKTLEIAKERFMEKLKTAEKVSRGTKVQSAFKSFTLYYFEAFRKKKISTATYQADINRCKKYLFSYFGEKPISKITPYECQELIETITNEGKGKTADEIYSLMSIIFKGAILHDIIKKNPLDLVFHQKHESEHGHALTKDEENLLLENTKGTPYGLMFAVILYTGMRPNEYSTAEINGDFIVCKNSKRKNKKVEYKKIPITPMLAPYITEETVLKFYNTYSIRDKFNSILPNHILYDLRTTFYSRLKECNVADNAIKEFVGHSLGALGNTYTDLSDEYLLKEGQKFLY